MRASTGGEVCVSARVRRRGGGRKPDPLPAAAGVLDRRTTRGAAACYQPPIAAHRTSGRGAAPLGPSPVANPATWLLHCWCSLQAAMSCVFLR